MGGDQDRLDGEYAELETYCQSQPNYYADRLASVNTHTPVVATEDIYNANGALVVREGSPIDRASAGKLVRHKLLKSIGEQVTVDRLLTNEDMLNCFYNLCEQLPDIRTVHEALTFDERFRSLVLGQHLPSTLVQKLTVYQHEAPTSFERGILCGWLCGLMASQIHHDRDFERAAFLAGLVRDIGFLHLPPELSDQDREFSDSDWKAMHSHALIGYLILREMPQLDGRVAQAVLQHHERIDGSGYPAGKEGQQLEQIGQIVAVADSIQAVRLNKLDHLGIGLEGVVPFLQLNQKAHFPQVIAAAHGLIKRANLGRPSHNPFEDTAAFAEHLGVLSGRLSSVVDLLDQIQTPLSQADDGQAKRAASAAIERARTLIHSSGLARAELIEWLATVRDESESTELCGLTEVYLLQSELVWHLRNGRRFCDAVPSLHAGSMARLWEDLWEQVNEAAAYLQEAYP